MPGIPEQIAALEARVGVLETRTDAHAVAHELWKVLLDGTIDAVVGGHKRVPAPVVEDLLARKQELPALEIP